MLCAALFQSILLNRSLARNEMSSITKAKFPPPSSDKSTAGCVGDGSLAECIHTTHLGPLHTHASLLRSNFITQKANHPQRKHLHLYITRLLVIRTYTINEVCIRHRRIGCRRFYDFNSKRPPSYHPWIGRGGNTGRES
jgi:hypothetical protein